MANEVFRILCIDHGTTKPGITIGHIDAHGHYHIDLCDTPSLFTVKPHTPQSLAIKYGFIPAANTSPLCLTNAQMEAMASGRYLTYLEDAKCRCAAAVALCDQVAQKDKIISNLEKQITKTQSAIDVIDAQKAALSAVDTKQLKVLSIKRGKATIRLNGAQGAKDDAVNERESLICMYGGQAAYRTAYDIASQRDVHAKLRHAVMAPFFPNYKDDYVDVVNTPKTISELKAAFDEVWRVWAQFILEYIGLIHAFVHEKQEATLGMKNALSGEALSGIMLAHLNPGSNVRPVILSADGKEKMRIFPMTGEMVANIAAAKRLVPRLWRPMVPCMGTLVADKPVSAYTKKKKTSVIADVPTKEKATMASIIGYVSQYTGMPLTANGINPPKHAIWISENVMSYDDKVKLLPGMHRPAHLESREAFDAWMKKDSDEQPHNKQDATNMDQSPDVICLDDDEVMIVLNNKKRKTKEGKFTSQPVVVNGDGGIGHTKRRRRSKKTNESASNVALLTGKEKSAAYFKSRAMPWLGSGGNKYQDARREWNKVQAVYRVMTIFQYHHEEISGLKSMVRFMHPQRKEYQRDMADSILMFLWFATKHEYCQAFRLARLQPVSSLSILPYPMVPKNNAKRGGDRVASNVHTVPTTDRSVVSHPKRAGGVVTNVVARRNKRQPHNAQHLSMRALMDLDDGGDHPLHALTPPTTVYHRANSIGWDNMSEDDYNPFAVCDTAFNNRMEEEADGALPMMITSFSSHAKFSPC